MKAAGVCPRCTAIVDSSVKPCERHDADDGRCPACGYAEAVRIRWTCSVCKYHGSASVATAAVHPLVEAFYTDHGVGVGMTLVDYEAAAHYLSLLRAHEQELVSTDPLRVRVTVRHEGDTLELVFDDSMAVVAPGVD
jgi:ribosomal protein L37AE/L43A